MRLALFFGNDLVHATSCGKTKPSKHILLPFAVKSLTGNVELIRTLNRHCHCISYLQLEEVDTALCLQKLVLSGCEVALPRNIQLNVVITLASIGLKRPLVEKELHIELMGLLSRQKTWDLSH